MPLPDGDTLAKPYRNVTNLDLIIPMTFRDRFQRRNKQLGPLLIEGKLDDFPRQPFYATDG